MKTLPNRQKSRRILHAMWAVVGILLCATLLSAIICYGTIRVTNYSLPLSGVTTPVRGTMIADTHGREFGENNSRLIQKIQDTHPDVIFLVGDMVDREDSQKEVDGVLQLIRSLQAVAPVYFAPGNHEMDYLKKDPTLLDQVAAAGAAVVNDSFVDVTIHGQPLRIGGTMGHGFPFGRTWEEFAASPEYVFLKEFEDTDSPTLCLAHRPDTFIFNDAQKYWNVDLVLSGHTHGGLIRIPGIGGLVAPMQGFFPKYDRGYFRLGQHIQIGRAHV